MISSPFELSHDDHNPLDLIEDLASHKNWYFERVTPYMLTLQMAGQRAKYDVQIEWQEEFCALQFSAFMNLPIDKSFDVIASDLLMRTNEAMWLGHFIIDAATRQPTYRYTMMLEHIPSAVSVEMVADMVDVAVDECDRRYATFHMLSQGRIDTRETLCAAMMETVGEA